MPRFELKGKVALDGSKWEAGLTQAKRSADRWSSETAGMIKRRLASAFAVASLWRGFTAVVDKAVDIRNKAGKIDVDAETFQALDYSAQQSGGSVDDVTQSVIELGKKQQEVAKGSKDVTEAFQRFGLEFDDVVNRNPVDLLMDISKAVNNGVNGQNLMADIDKLLSGSGQNLITAFKSDFAGMMNEGRSMPTFTNAQNAEIASVGDEMTRANKGLWSKVGKGIASGKDAFETIASQNQLVSRYLGNFLGGEFGTMDQDSRSGRLLEKHLENQLRELKEIKRNTEPLR